MSKPTNRMANPVGLVGGKQIGHEMLPTRQALATITKGSPAQRTISNYAKQTPADANGMGSVGLNTFTPGK